MKNVMMGITEGLDERCVELILDDIHRLVSEVGVEIQHPELRDELAGHDGVTVKDERVCYSGDLIEKAFDEIPLEDMNYATHALDEENYSMVTPYSPFDALDFETGEKRPARDEDVIDGAQLFDAFDCEGHVHVHIGEMDQNIAQMHIAKLCCENSRGIGKWSPAFTYEQAICIRDMQLAAGRSEPYMQFQTTHSPLRLDANFLGILMRARQSENGTRGFTVGGGAMPVPGISAPLYWRAAAAQGAAENIACWITVKLIDPTVKPYVGFGTWAPDMHTGKWVFSSPEATLFNLLERELQKKIFKRVLYGSGGLLKMCFQAMQGTRVFGSAGASKNAFSLAHIPIAYERLHFVESFMKGVPFQDEEGVGARITRELFPNTSFLMHESSLEYRDLYWQPKYFSGVELSKLSGWLSSDSDNLLPQARDIARAKLAEHHFELPDDVKREVNRIYELGCKAQLAAHPG